MMNSISAMRLSAACAFTIALSACGGGGGGGGDGGGNNAPAASFAASPSSLTFHATAANAAAPPPQTLTGSVSGTINGTLFINITLGGSIVTVSDVVINGPNSGQVHIIPRLPSALGPGTHSDTLTVRACTTNVSCTSGQLAGSPQTVAVTYNIDGLRSSSNTLTYAVNDASLATDFSKLLPVSGYPSNATWTATTSAPWLTTPASGALSGGVAELFVRVDQTQADAMPNGEYTASVLLTPQSGNNVTIPVTLSIDRSEVSFVAPYVAEAGTSREVIIRGERFPESPAVSFGGTPAVAINRVGPQEIRATYPASLSAGAHAVRVDGINRSRANLVVVGTPSYSAERLSYSSGFKPKRIIYDAERKTILVVRYDDMTSASNEYVRFIHGPGGWSAAERRTIFNLTDMALTTDGTEWLATRFSPISVQHFSATDLTLRSTSIDEEASSSAFLSKLAVANNGFAIMAGGSGGGGCGGLANYRVRAPRFVRFNPIDAFYCSQFVAASADGSVVIAGTNGRSAVDRYDASTYQVAALSPNPGFLLTSPPVLDRHASRLVLNARVYSANFTQLGDLPATTKAVALSADGSVAWTFDTSGDVRKFDLLGATVAGFFPEIGSGTPVPATPGSGEVIMTTTPESGTLFIAGTEGVVVLPAP